MTRKKVMMFLIELFIIALVYFTLFTYVISSVRISGDSMYPTLHDEDFALVSKVSLNDEGIERFDIVYFYSESLDLEVVKRVIGLPGDTVEYQNDKLYINGDYLEEPYLDIAHMEELKTQYGIENFTQDFQFTVPEDELFVLGDNRPRSTDSRSFGSISYDSIIGKRGIILYPFSNIEWIE